MRREVFQTSGPLTLDLRLPSGEIEVQATQEQETIVELDASRDNEEIRAAIENARIELRQRGDGDEVLVDVERKRFGFLFDLMRGELTLRIHAPEDADIHVSTSSGDVDVRGRFGELKAQIASGDLRGDEFNGRVEVKSASGDVDLQTLGDNVSIATASGDIRIHRVHGDATLRSASGDVAVDEAEDSVTIQTASGDHRIGEVVAGRVALTSASGDMQIGVRSGSRVRLDVKTMSGDASSELEVRDRPGEGTGPDLEIRATSMSGDIRIHRA